jgi:tRNA(fMet)-specific endonuclease VapC
VKYLLDGNVVIAMLKGHEKVLGRLRQHHPSDIGLPAVVTHELYYGAYKSLRVAKNLAVLDALQFAVVEFDREDAVQAGEIRAAFAVAGTPIGPYDVLIAGQAVSRNLILVTRNECEFLGVKALQVENWKA